MRTSVTMESGTSKVPREVWRRWTTKLVHGGWTPVSDFFLEHYRDLKLTTPEAMLVIHLMRHKWDERPPRPSFKTLAGRMGITDTAVRGHARSLEHKGFLKRIIRLGLANQFDLTPLFIALERLQSEIDAKAEREQIVQEPAEVIT